MLEYGLSVDIITVITDNASNIIGARNIRCMAHTLNLACQKALKISGIDRIVGKVRHVVKFFRRSNLASNFLQKALTQMSMPKLKPIIDVQTRWNSTLHMLERYMKIRPAVYIATTTNSQIKIQYDTLTEHEAGIVKQLIEVGRPKPYFITYQFNQNVGGKIVGQLHKHVFADFDVVVLLF